MGFSIQRNGFTSAASMATSLIQDLKDNGFTPLWVNNGTIADATTTATRCTLETSLDSNSLHDTQPWRITIWKDDNNNIVVVWGTENSLAAEDLTNRFTRGHQRPYMELITKEAFEETNTYGYRMTITDRGLVMYVYDETNLTAMDRFGLVHIQRPVNPNTGVALTTGEAPVLAILKEYDQRYFMKSVVRTANYAYPQTKNVSLISPSADAVNGWTFHWPKTSIQTDGTYTIVFPNGLATDDSVYLEEMDMVGKSRAVEYMFGQGVDVNMYGEGTDRTYMAYQSGHATEQNAARIFVLTTGGGI